MSRTRKPKTTTQERMNEIADEVISQISEGNLPQWSKPWNGLFSPTNGHTGKGFTGLNVWASIMAMSRNNYSSPLFVAAGQAKKLIEEYNKENNTELVAFVKGGKADTYHFRPIQYKVKSKEGDDEETSRFLTGFTGYAVWNIENTNIPSEWAFKRLNVEINEPVEVSDLLSTVESNLKGVTFATGGAAYYTPRTDVITMPPLTAWESENDYAAVLLHEAAHATGHPHRLARPLEGMTSRGTDYATEELIAELASIAACGALGYEADLTRSSAYLSGWASRTPQKEARAAILKALSRSIAAAEWVITGAPDRHEGPDSSSELAEGVLDGITTE